MFRFPPDMAAHIPPGFQFPPDFGFSTPPPRQPQAQEVRRGENYVPPASALARERLPQVVVTKEDLLDEANHECAICLDEQNMGRKATKLPCGHLFCHLCIIDWLARNCSCPTCRFELPTGDAQYERQRRERMQQRKAQYRIGEMMSLSVRELKNILASHQVRIPAGCCEKKEMIDALMTAHDVVILPEHEAAVYNIAELEAMSREQLVNLFRSLRLATPDDSASRQELLEMLINSGRRKVDFSRCSNESLPSNAKTHPIPNVDAKAAPDAAVSQEVRSSWSVPEPHNATPVQKFSLLELKNLSVANLKKLLAEEGVNLPSGAVEKFDLVQLVPRHRVQA
eukprot:GEMP01039241.1.p1 GENE.GEMP01039241.1~~GEMP01039241.1.p1  ORF type:complete len:340 (+),score=76.10 GEMP01039241.1:33-1052(+)